MIRTMAVVVGLLQGGVSLSAAALAFKPSELVSPQQWCPDIEPYSELDLHYVAPPVTVGGAAPRNHLVVFLGGSGSNTQNYTEISDHVAGLGFPVINLSYINEGSSRFNNTIAAACKDDDGCYQTFRAEIMFGADVVHGQELRFDNDLVEVSKQNSVVNRLICTLAYLSRDTVNRTQEERDYWAQFLKLDAASPYTLYGPGTPVQGYSVDWSKVIVSGHSQGGGNAAYLAVTLQSTLRRVVLFSSPQDKYTPPRGGLSNPPPEPLGASWISAYSSATPLTRYWGLVNEDEGSYGDFVRTNWQRFRDADGPFGIGGNDPARRDEQKIADSSTIFDGSQRLIFPEIPPLQGGTKARNHWSTAVNFSGNLNQAEQARAANRRRIWTQMFTAAQPE